MSAKRDGAPTTYQELAQRLEQRLGSEAEWNRRLERKRKEAAAELRRCQRAALRALDLPLDALELVEGGLGLMTTALEAVARPADVLVLSGGVGTGKTVAAVSWLHGWVTDHRNWQDSEAGPQLQGRALFFTAPALLRSPRFDEKWTAIVKRANRLVIDDLGSEYDEKGSFAALVEEIVSDRYARRRPTLITTNCDADVFKRRYGARISDRIRERGRFQSVGNKSMRGKS